MTFSRLSLPLPRFSFLCFLLKIESPPPLPPLTSHPLPPRLQSSAECCCGCDCGCGGGGGGPRGHGLWQEGARDEPN